MVIGFCLAAFAVIGNDTIQTLGTFLSSNAKKPWYILAGYIGLIMVVVLVYGWYTNDGDVSYGRLEKVGPLPDPFYWYFLLPPLILLIITKLGIPVSTTFLVISVFSQKLIGPMLVKSLTGYAVAFGAGAILYLVLASTLEKTFQSRPLEDKNKTVWTVLQWASTGWLWSQWLIQDLANIYVYLPRSISPFELGWTILVLVVLLAIIFKLRGGEIQKIVTSKTMTHDIRSATIIDFTYGVILMIFKEWSKIPMSTTWVFIGLLAGREIMLTLFLTRSRKRDTIRIIASDAFKAGIGLAVSVAMVYLIQLVK
jgi:hypothetical protein